MEAQNNYYNEKENVYMNESEINKFRREWTEVTSKIKKRLEEQKEVKPKREISSGGRTFRR